jgi:AcrR family transcriptional regulator
MPSSKELIPIQKKILIEAEKILGKKGISGLELKYIAKILKVAPSTINYHYSSSEELIFDTALFSYKKYVQTIFDESANISDPEKVLRIWIKIHLNGQRSCLVLVLFLNFQGRLLNMIRIHQQNLKSF